MELAEVLQIIYDKSAFKYYMKEVKLTLSETLRLRGKLEGTATQVSSLCQGTIDMIVELRKLQKTKGDMRVFYDYYREKVPKL